MLFVLGEFDWTLTSGVSGCAGHHLTRVSPALSTTSFAWSLLVPTDLLCFHVVCHSQSSDLGSVVSSLSTCCLVRLPPHGFSCHLCADISYPAENSASIPDQSLPGLLPQGLQKYDKQNSSSLPPHLPKPAPSSVFYSLMNGTNGNSRYQSRNLGNILEFLFIPQSQQTQTQ